jgi:hypothetical protein
MNNLVGIFKLIHTEDIRDILKLMLSQQHQMKWIQHFLNKGKCME